MAPKKQSFDPEAAFKSIIGADASAEVSAPAKPVGRGRPVETNREKKKRYSLSLYPSDYEALQKIAFVNRTDVSKLIGELMSNYVEENQSKLKEYDKLKSK